MAEKTLLITQARMASTRLPGKILMEIQGQPLLKIHLDRLKHCQNVSKLIVATTDTPEDDRTAALVESWGGAIYRGSEHDVLGRFYQAALPHRPDWIVRVTADCPLIDPALVDEIINFTQTNQVDYGSNVLLERFPDGQDIEVFTFDALEKSYLTATKKSEREHVTLYIRNNISPIAENYFRAVNFTSENDYSKIRMTVDEAADFALVKHLIEELGTDKSWLEYTEYLMNSELSQINAGIIRNEGLLKSLKEDQP
ncbi:cytidylyltransferase domain-containing protein [Salmonirosea aquatica]|uniref:cytidylyltransferase domain-containing protein n=1 Tax=Salmonirosea aquatica TaxID=2654236 RepID=UPI003571184A